MTQIAISDKAASILATAAASRGCTQEELASMYIEEGQRREEEFVITDAVEARLLESIAQSERGESVEGDRVMARFNKALQEIASR